MVAVAFLTVVVFFTVVTGGLLAARRFEPVSEELFLCIDISGNDIGAFIEYVD